MTEALAHLPMGEPLLLVLLVVGGLALRRLAGGRAAAVGTGMVWLAFAIALVWLGLNVVTLMQLMLG